MIMPSNEPSNYILRFTKQDILDGFETDYSKNDQKTQLGIVICLKKLDKFINEELGDCTSSIKNSWNTPGHSNEIDELICGANKTTGQHQLEKFLSSLKENKDFSKLIMSHLLLNYNMGMFEQSVDKILEYRSLDSDMVKGKSKEEIEIKKVKI
jgi:hypothetical protein